MQAHDRQLLGAVSLALALVVSALVGGTLTAGPAVAATPTSIAAADETVPVPSTGDAADDPAIWVHPTDPSRSLVLGNDKRASALDSYDLDGNLVQHVDTPAGFFGNVDLRQDNVAVPTAPRDVIAVAHLGLSLYTIDPATRLLQPITDGSIGVWGEGLCMSSTPTGLYAFVISRAGLVRQVSLTDADRDGLLAGRVVRSFDVGSEAEGCVVDDAAGALYVSEEDVALWRYSAAPSGGTTRTAVDTVVGTGGNLTPDIEGVTLVDQGGTAGYLIASAQNGAAVGSSSFGLYDRSAPNTFRTLFRVSNGIDADDCDGTDGVAAYAGNLGPRYPDGLFVCQDNSNAAPGSAGNQDFKYVDLADIITPPANQPPVAAFTSSCTGLSCALDGSSSRDPDGAVATWTWDFGDGTVGSGATPGHTWATGGTWPVALTVTDDDGASSTLQQSVTVAPAPAAALSFTGAASTNGNRTTHTVTIPAAVAPGDRLLLFLTVNTTTGTLTPPGGWTQVVAHDQDGVRSAVWTRIAVAGDAGSAASVQTSAYGKSDLTVTAHRSTSGTPSVAASAYTFVASPGSTLVSPVVPAAQGSWLVTYWGAKGGTGPWTPPADQTVRSESHGTGGGPVHALVTDSGVPLPAGSTGGVSAQLAQPPGRAIVYSVVLAP